MKLMTPPGELLAKVDADPPRTDSMRSTDQSDLRKMSALPKAMSPNSRTGRPSSCNCRNFAPPDAAGRPRTMILALPALPPPASERIPGILRKISAVLRGAYLPTSSTLIEFTETLLRNSVVVPAEAVTTTVSNDVSAVGSVGVLPSPDRGVPDCGAAVCACPTEANALITKSAVKTFLAWSMPPPFAVSLSVVAADRAVTNLTLLHRYSNRLHCLYMLPWQSGFSGVPHVSARRARCSIGTDAIGCG